MAHISIVIPVYKAEGCLEELYVRLKAALSPISEDFEILLIEDCGGDNSWQVIKQLASLDARVKGFQFSRNFGQHYGITAGIDQCQGDWVVVMDCDLQDRPEEIPNLYRKALEGFDVVLARRGARKDPPLKKLTSWMFYRVFSYLADIDYDGETGNFRIISKQVVKSLQTMRESLRFFGGMVAWVGFPTASIDVAHEERFCGKTSYTFRSLWKLASATIISYSDKPLRLSIRFGFTISLLAFLYGGFIAYRAMFHGAPIAGWSSLIASIYFLGGVIISILGVMGVYLGKVFDETKQRPLYIIAASTVEGADGVH